jgi:hypothetical protein
MEFYQVTRRRPRNFLRFMMEQEPVRRLVCEAAGGYISQPLRAFELATRSGRSITKHHGSTAYSVSEPCGPAGNLCRASWGYASPGALADFIVLDMVGRIGHQRLQDAAGCAASGPRKRAVRYYRV